MRFLLALSLPLLCLAIFALKQAATPQVTSHSGVPGSASGGDTGLPLIAVLADTGLVAAPSWLVQTGPTARCVIPQERPTIVADEAAAEAWFHYWQAVLLDGGVMMHPGDKLQAIYRMQQGWWLVVGAARWEPWLLVHEQGELWVVEGPDNSREGLEVHIEELQDVITRPGRSLLPSGVRINSPEVVAQHVSRAIESSMFIEMVDGSEEVVGWSRADTYWSLRTVRQRSEHGANGSMYMISLDGTYSGRAHWSASGGRARQVVKPPLEDAEQVDPLAADG